MLKKFNPVFNRHPYLSFEIKGMAMNFSFFRQWRVIA